MFDAARIRNDFPILSRLENGRPLVYLDSAATTQKPDAVIDAISGFYRSSNANIHRGVYRLAEEATDLYEGARAKTARFIGAKSVKSVVFTRNTTESINLVAHAWARRNLKAGDEILLTEMEHHANFVPWYLLSKEAGVRLSVARINADGTLDMADFKRRLTPAVKLVAFTAVSNVLGTRNPVSEMCALARKNGSAVLVDGAQSAPHEPTDVEAMGCDFFAFSAHKMLGPTGVGVLWIRDSRLDEMNPFMGGGEMIETVSVENTTWAEPPLKFEAGTSNFADSAAFGTALDYLTRLGMDAVRAHEKELLAYALERLEGTPNLVIYGPKNPEVQGGAISFNHSVVHAHDVGTILSEEGVAVRVGHHCAQPLMRALKTPATARISFYIYTTKADIDAFVAAFAKVDRVFGLTAGSRP